MPEYIESKTILSKLKQAPDPYFGITFNMNLYRGCQHQCIYCDSRSIVYQLGNLAHIRVKKNALTLLEKELKSKRMKGTIGTGSMNDPYMPIEAKERLTRSALEIINRFNYPVHVITKSNLVTRDMDVLEEISKTYAAVSFTITTPSDSLSRVIEPGAVISSNRFAAMQQLAKQDIYTGVILTPVLPYITDKEEDIKLLIQKAGDAGAQYIIGWMGMTQREGQREYYYNQLDKHFPGVRERYQTQYGSQYSCAAPQSVYLNHIFSDMCNKLNMPMEMQFYTDSNPQQLNLFA